MNMRRIATLISLTLFATLPAAVRAEVYSWKDANGKVHYGSKPPVGQQGEARKLAAPPAETSDQEAARKAAAERQMAEREKQQNAQDGAAKPPEDQAAKREREANCRAARANLATLESGQVRFTMNTKGERVALDGAALNAELAKARKDVDTWCKPPK